MAAGRKPRIHLTAVGSSATEDIRRLGIDNVGQLLGLVRGAVGDDCRVTASAKMIFSREEDPRGGRFDDAARAKEIEAVLADDDVAALVTIRGGAWFTRILDRIDFERLRRRKRPLYVFGFSEMTTLINIAGWYPQVVGLYDLGPGFLFGGTRSWAKRHADKLTRGITLAPDQTDAFAAGYARAGYPQAFEQFFREVAGILRGVPSPRVPAGRVLAGRLPAAQTIRIVGGNLSVLLPLVGSAFTPMIDTAGKWLALEDVNENADQIDRMMAGLKLHGLFERCRGVILGDFHTGNDDLSDAAFHALKHHLPARRKLPVIRLDNFGHIYPLAPLPLHRDVVLRCTRGRSGPAKVRLEIPWGAWAKG